MPERTSGCRSGAVHLQCYKCSRALRSKGVWPGRPYEAAQPARVRLLAARVRPARRDCACACAGGRTARFRNPAGRDRSRDDGRAGAGRAGCAERAGRAHLHARILHPLRAPQRARHAEQRARLRDRRRRHRPARPWPGDRQRADQRRALLGQVGRHLHRAAPDQRQQRHPDRDRRRRDAECPRPHRPGRQHHHRLARPDRQLHLAAADPGPSDAGTADQRRSLAQRLDRRHRLHPEPAQRFLPQRQCRAGDRLQARRHDHRSPRRGAERQWRAAADQRHAPPQFRRRLDPQRQRRLRPLPYRHRGGIAAFRPGPARPGPQSRGARARI